MTSADERTRKYREERARTPTFPIRRFVGEPPPGPDGFGGTWIHTSTVKDQILADGWKPEFVKNTIYGSAIYLARDPWKPGAPEIHVVLELAEDEVLREFDHDDGVGCTQDDFIWHLKSLGVVSGKAAEPGNSSRNRRIRDHLLERGIRAVRFMEHGTEVVAVFDPTAIQVLPV